MRPETPAKNTLRRTWAPPNGCDVIKNTTPRMPARFVAPGAPLALPRLSEALPRCPPGAAQARPRRSPGGAPAAKRPQALQALVSAAKQKPEAGVARRCQALLGGTQHSQQLLGAPRRCPIAPRRHQALPWRSHARPRRPPGAPRRGTGAATAATGVSKRFWALPGRRGCLAPPRRSRRSSAPPRRCQTVLNASPKALSTGVTRRIKAPRGVSWRPRGVTWRSQALPRRSQASPSAPWRSPDAPRRTPCTSKRSPVAPRRCQAPPSAPRRIARLSLWRRAKLHNASPMRRQSAVESYPLVASTPCRTAAASDWSVA